jgi:hypothetical protein
MALKITEVPAAKEAVVHPITKDRLLCKWEEVAEF